MQGYFYYTHKRSVKPLYRLYVLHYWEIHAYNYIVVCVQAQSQARAYKSKRINSKLIIMSIVHAFLHKQNVFMAVFCSETNCYSVLSFVFVHAQNYFAIRVAIQLIIYNYNQSLYNYGKLVIILTGNGSFAMNIRYSERSRTTAAVFSCVK